MTDPRSEALDPATPAARLADLAADHPELRGDIARHPALYDGLRDWMAADPDTPAAALPAIADGHPETWAAIEQHPNSYPGLRDWIEDRRAEGEGDDVATGSWSVGDAAGAGAGAGAGVGVGGDEPRPAVSARGGEDDRDAQPTSVFGELFGGRGSAGAERGDASDTGYGAGAAYGGGAGAGVGAGSSAGFGAVGASGAASSGPGGTSDGGSGGGSDGRDGRRSRRPLVIGIVLAAILVVVIAIAIPVAFSESSRTDAGGTPSGAASGSASPGASGSASPSATPSTPSRLPAECAGLFSDGYRTNLTNRGYALAAGAAPVPADAQLAGLLTAAKGDRRDCVWTAKTGGGTIATTVVELDADAAAQVSARLAAAGFGSVKEAKGTRYYTQNSAGGESDMVVDGLWFCTVYKGFGPTGYTADMVATVLG